MRKKLAMLAVMALTALSTPITAFAAPEVFRVNGTDIIFDSDYYASANPDVAAVVGTDTDALLQHYISSGQYEGRLPYAPGADSAYGADTNLYGNTMGNIYNDGAFVYDKAGNAFYFYNVYESCVMKTDAATGRSSVISNKPVSSLNYRDGRLYGVELAPNADTGSLVVLDVATGSSTVLRTAPVQWIQLVNNEIYFTDANDHLLRRLDVSTGEERVLTAEPVYYPVVYKNQVIFQLDSDNESLYAMPKDGGVMTKLNNYHSYYPLVDNDKVYYQTKENGTYRLRSMNLDGSGDEVLMNASFWGMNINNGRYYFIKEGTPNKISYIELSDSSHTIKELQLEPSIRSALNRTYGVAAMQVTAYTAPQFAGNYALVMCDEVIDGGKYFDEYLYVMSTNETLVIPEFCSNSQTVAVPAGATKEEQALAVAQSIANSIPAGSDLERVRAAAEIVAGYCSRASYTSDDPDYKTAYGVFCKGVYTCAGATRALGLVLDCMGYDWSHINENMYTHQWCELVMDGQAGWADGMGGIADYGVCPFKYGGTYTDAYGRTFVAGF